MEDSLHWFDIDGTKGTLARCAALLAEQPAWAVALAELREPQALLEALDAGLQARGIALDIATRKSIVEGRQIDSGCRVTSWPLAMRSVWTPTALEWGAHGAELVWGCGEHGDAVFREHVVARLRSLPLNRLFAIRTPLSETFVAAMERDALPLSGLVFHMSRCGSTLVMRALRAWPGVRTICEPALLDAALVLGRAGADAQWSLLRAVVAALLQPHGNDRRVVIKFDAWHALALAQIAAKLPAPWLFVYRDPAEVLASHRNEDYVGASRMVQEASAAGATFASEGAIADAVAQALGAICAAVLPHASANRLLDFNELPGALQSRVAPAFGLDPEACDRDILDDVLVHHAKRPAEAYADDRAAKRATIDAATYAASGRWVGQSYDALQDLRYRIRRRRLRVAVDIAALREDLARVEAMDWRAHFNREYYEGDWSGIALRAQPHGKSPLYSDPTREDFADTEAMRLCRYIPELLRQFECPVESVRFLKVAAGSQILEHRDYGLNFESGKARIHIPVRTNAEVEFVVGGEALALLEGDCWYIDFDLPHRVANNGREDRIHLVIDLRVNVWLDELVRASA